MRLKNSSDIHTLPCWPCRSRNLEGPRSGDHCKGNSQIVSRRPLRERGPMSARRPSCLRPCKSRARVCFQRHNLPSVCSKSSSSSLQLFSRGRVRSHSSPSTMEMTVRSNSDFEIALAIDAGVVSHDVPFSSFPLGRETVISSRGFAMPVSLVSSPVAETTHQQSLRPVSP